MKTYVCTTAAEFNHFIGNLEAEVETDGKSTEVLSCWYTSEHNNGTPEVYQLSEGAYAELCAEAEEKFKEEQSK